MLNLKKYSARRMPPLAKTMMTQNNGVETYCISYIVTLPSAGGAPPLNDEKKEENINENNLLGHEGTTKT